MVLMTTSLEPLSILDSRTLSKTDFISKIAEEGKLGFAIALLLPKLVLVLITASFLRKAVLNDLRQEIPLALAGGISWR